MHRAASATAELLVFFGCFRALAYTTLDRLRAVLFLTDTLWLLTGLHLWRSEYSSYITGAQMKFCRRLIVVPLSTFHRMAEVIGDPSGELIFLFMTGRCGSILLTQVTSDNLLHLATTL